MTKSGKSKRIEFGVLANAEGSFDRPISSGEYAIPIDIKIVGDRLVWEDSLTGLNKWRREQPEKNILTEFVQLAEASDKQEFPQRVLRYAQRHGVLNLCEQHSAPASHNPICASTSTLGSELVRPWLRYAEVARSILNIGARLTEGQLGMEEDWRVLRKHGWIGKDFPWWKSGRKPYSKDSEEAIEHERQIIASLVNGWMAQGNVRPTINWKNSKPTLTIEGGSQSKLFAILSIQLMLAVSSTEGLAICSACGMSYIPKRRPRVGEKHYCQACGRAAAIREASANYRRKNRKGTLIPS
jgi:hypothetical protein